MQKGLVRIMAIGLVFTLISLFSVSASGAQESETEGKPIEVTFWSLFTGGDGEFFDAMVEEFNRTHDRIVMKTDTVKFDDYYTKLTTALAGGTAPDVVVVHQSNLLGYVPKGVFYPLNDILDEMNAPVDDFVQGPLQDVTYDGNIYALPLDVHAFIMYYNKDLFEKAGIDEVPQSYDEFIAASQAIQEKTEAIGLAMDNTTATYKAYTLTRLFMSLLEQQGVSFLTDNLQAANFNNTAGKTALKGIIDIVNTHEITPKQLDYDGSVSEFKLGRAGMHFNGVWATGVFEAQEGLNFGATELPPLMGEPAAWSGSHTLAIPKRNDMDPAKLEAAITFILWMTEHGEMWAKAGHIPTRKSVYKKESFLQMPHRKNYSDAAAHAFAAPATPAWQEIYATASDILEYAVANNSDVDDTLDQLEETVNGILESY